MSRIKLIKEAISNYFMLQYKTLTLSQTLKKLGYKRLSPLMVQEALLSVIYGGDDNKKQKETDNKVIENKAEELKKDQCADLPLVVTPKPSKSLVLAKTQFHSWSTEEVHKDDLYVYSSIPLRKRLAASMCNSVQNRLSYGESMDVTVSDIDSWICALLLKHDIEPNPGPRGRGGRRPGMQRKVKKRGRKHYNITNPGPGANPVQLYTTARYMHPSEIRPRDVKRNLEYSSDLVRLASGAPFAVKTFRANSIFDPDPSILTTTYAGYANLMQVYVEYIVQKIVGTCKCWNYTPYPQNVYVSFSQEDLSLKYNTWQKVKDGSEQAFCSRVILLAPTGVATGLKIVKFESALQDLVGKLITYQASEVYSGQEGVDPPFSLFVNLCVYEMSGAKDVSDGIGTDFRMNADIEFFGSKIIGDTGPLSKINYMIEKNSEPLLVKQGTSQYDYMGAYKRGSRNFTLTRP